ncbi:MAG: T9SS type A sorting domain-containing protein [Bacteroidota bacterium]
MKKTIKQLILIFCVLGLLKETNAQNWGFEATPSTPPNTWTIVTGTWVTNTNPTFVRTGTQSMGITGPVTTGTTIYNTSASVVVPTSSTHFLITMAWAKASDPSNGVGYIGYRGTTTVLNPSTAAAGQPANMNNTSFSRIISVSTATVAAGSYGPAIRAFQTASATPATTVYTDDYIVYASTSNIPDTVSPNVVNSPVAYIGSPFAITWTNGLDTAANSSGRKGVIVLRTTGSVTTAPLLNNQATYHPSGGVFGTSSFTQAGNIWQVVGATTDSSVTYLNDTSAVSSTTYTYAVLNYDYAHNYSDAVLVTPTPGPLMTYVSSSVNKLTGTVRNGATFVMNRFTIQTTGNNSPLRVTKFNLSTLGSASPTTDILRARIFSTKASGVFDSTRLVGTFNSPNGSFSISGIDTLLPGSNFYWLVYDIPTGAINCNVVDAVSDSIIISGTLYIPSVIPSTGNVVVSSQLNGIYTINPTLPAGCGTNNFISILSAVNYLNVYGASGPVTFNVAAGSSYTHAPTILSTTGTLTAPIVFQKSGTGANPIVYGVNGVGTADGLIVLNGVNYITFDGIDLVDSISNTAALRMDFGYLIRNASATTGSSNNIIRNCKIILNRATTTSFGILQSASTTGGGVAATSLTGANHNNRYENVKIENTYKGISLIGTAGFPDSNCVVTSANGDTTIVGANTANDIGNGTALVYGINAADQKNVEISKCWVRNLTHTSTSTIQGIFIDNGSTTVDYGTARVWGNVVYNINRITSTSATGTVHGIRIDASTTANAIVYNNVVYAVSNTSTIATATANQMVRGISFGTTTGTGTASFFYNSVSINSSGLSNSTAAFWKGGAGNAIVRNNIFSNTSPAQTGVSKHYASYISAGTIAASNNVYWAPDVNGFVGFATTDKSSLAAFAAALTATSPADGNELGSANANPGFTSASNLTLAGTTPAVQSGVSIVSPVAITTDILGNARSTSSATTIGAYESTQILLDSAAPVITNVVIVNSASPTVTANISDNGNSVSAGDVRLWYRLGTTGVFTALVPDSIPTINMNGTYKWSTSLSSLPSGVYQFYIAARDVAGLGLNIAVNPIQATTFSGFNPSGPVNYLNNPDAGVTTRSFTKTATISSGTYAVGASSFPYLKLTDVANAVNAGQITGDLIFELESNYDGTTGEVFPITFNPLNTIGGNWTVTIRPATGVTGRETSGYPASAVPIINFDGADRIVLDGRPGGVGTSSEWTIKSKRSTVSTNSPCVQFINGAQSDSLLYLKLESGNTTTTSGTVLFSTTNASAGNSYNVISNCEIRDRSDSVGAPAVAIYSAGTAGFPNDSIRILNNNIFNWITSGIQSTATGNGAGWKISNNHFYMTTAQTTAQTAIRFLNASVKNIIENNFIGGSAVNAGGTAWTNSGSIAWRGIVANTSQTDSSFIRNNTIQNIALTGTSTGTYGGIELTGGLNSVNNNIIGSTSVANSIQSSMLGTHISLWSNGTTNVPNFYNNTVANITSTGNTTAVGHNGIRITSSVTAGTLTIKGNTIFGLSAANPTASISTASLVGILTLSPSTLQTIANNVVYDLTTSGGPTNNATTAIGINIDDAASVGNISANRVYNIKNISTHLGAKVFGINLTNGGTWTVANNMVALGSDVVNDIIIVGINDSITGALNLYNNSVLISGVNGTAVDTSSAYRRFRTSNVNSRNNIFGNIRTSASINYASAIYTATPATTYKANYNALYTNSSQIGLWLGVSRDFSDWKTVTLHDSNSANLPTAFVANTNLHLTSPTIGDVTFAGRPIAGVTTDFDGEPRDLAKPYMGADENVSSPLPVKLVLFTAKKANNDVVVEWSTSSEINTNLFVVEASHNGKDFFKVASVKAMGNSSNLVNYRSMHTNAKQAMGNIAYYRLLAIDNDKFTETSNTVKVIFDEAQASIELYPNPFTDVIHINFTNSTSEVVNVTITDINGKQIMAENYNLKSAKENVEIKNLTNLKAGIYFVQVTTGTETKTVKMVK